MRKYRRAFWIVAALGAALLIPIWIYLNVLQSTLATRPHEPHPENGWTAPYAGKGGTVYVAPRERDTVVWLSRIDFGLVVVIALCGILAGGQYHRQPRKPG